MVRTNQRAVFLKWMILVGAIAVTIWFVFQLGLVQQMLNQDTSYLSLAIVAVFILTSLHAGSLAYKLSVMQDEVAAYRQIKKLSTADQQATDNPAVETIVSRPLSLLFESLMLRTANTPEDLQSHMSILERRIKAPQQTGWLIADFMIKLGLLGTVVGFILMLASISNVTKLDTSTMQSLLTNMGGGMRVALYTTLAGLVGGILAGFQYQLIDHASEHLLAEVEEAALLELGKSV